MKNRNLQLAALPLLITFVMILPIIWLIFTSFKTDGEIFGATPTFFPRTFTLENYQAIFSNLRFVQYGINSIAVSVISTAVVIGLAIPAGYGYSKFFSFRYKATALVGVLVGRMLPPIAIVIPLYMMFSKINLLNTLTGLIVINVAIALPLAIWMFVVFFDSIPASLMDAARVDGCSKLGVLWHVILPLSKTITASVMTITFLTTWNLFIIPLIFSSSAEAKTLPVAISELAFGEYGTAWGRLAALSTIMLIPVILIAIWAQRYLTSGLTAGAEKG